jgi:hypothetical protein
VAVVGVGPAAEAWGLRAAGIVFALAVSVLAVVYLAAILAGKKARRQIS